MALPRLIGPFAVYTGLALALMAATLMWFVREETIDQAKASLATQVQYIADSAVRHRLGPRDLIDGPPPDRRDQVLATFEQDVLVGGAHRANLISLDGTTVFSTDPAEIGSTESAATIAPLVAGTATSIVAFEDGDLNGPHIEVYVPIRFEDGSAPSGVLEVYSDYAPVAAQIRQTTVGLAVVILLAALALYGSLFPILWRASRRLRTQAAENEFQARHDMLTGLPNRLRLRDAVQSALARSGEGSRGALMLLDLDRFKEINDTLGHRYGDEVLREIADRLRAIAPSSGVVARLGGDEFAVLAPGLTDPVVLKRLAGEIEKAVGRPVVLDDLSLAVEASIGTALFPEHGSDPETLLQRADVAMYAAKAEHSGHEIYSAELDTTNVEGLALIGELGDGIRRGELVVHYQPKIDLRRRTVIGVEALVRWQHPVRGLVPPDRFVPLAERSGLIKPLTQFVIESALTQLGAWRQRGLHLTMAVNISVRHLLDATFAGELAEAIARHRIDPGLVHLEITESMVMDNPRRAHDALLTLRDIGVKIELDDFGTGQSSLSYLKELPIDGLKIDRSFVMGMATSSRDGLIVRSTIDLGHSLGLHTIAEGVESEEISSQLVELGCDLAQGYEYSRPLPPDQFDTWLAENALSLAAATRDQLGTSA